MSETELKPEAWVANCDDSIPQYFDSEKAARVFCGTSEWVISPLYNHPRPAVPEGYAGATVWIGDKRVTQVVTEETLKYERETGMAIAHATQACLDLLAAARPDVPHLAEAIGLLRELRDAQNGPPLERYKKDYYRTMDSVDELLERYEGHIRRSEGMRNDEQS